MAVKPEQVAEYLGYTNEQLEGFENFDAFKEDADKEFIRRKEALKDKEFKKAITGEYFGSQTTKFKSTAKTFGVEFSPDEIKDATPEKLFELSMSKQAAAATKALEEKEKQIVNPDEAVKEWKTKYENEQKLRRDVSGLLETTKAEFTQHKEQSANQIKNAKLSFQEEQVFSTLAGAYKPNINEVEKIGFKTAVKSKAKFDFDEHGNFIVTDLEGHMIPNKNKHGEFVKPDEYLKTLGLEYGVIPANPHSKQTPKPFTPQTPKLAGQEQNNNAPLRKINSYRPTVNTGR